MFRSLKGKLRPDNHTKEARFYSTSANNSVRCRLCPHNCLLQENEIGKCRVRQNTSGKLYTNIYGLLSAVHIDPIEKKPLYHYYPGTQILSVGSVGCNFSCTCCQNYSISQTGAGDFGSNLQYTPDQIVEQGLNVENSAGLAFTYNEPSIGFEFVYDTALASKNAGMKNVMVSNGYINAEPLEELLSVINAFNIDLKVFNDSKHRKFTGGVLKPVLNNLKRIHHAGHHLEITHLVVPGVNDNLNEFSEMISWIDTELDKNVPLHISRYFPNFNYTANPTPVRIIDQFVEFARDKLSFVYSGNVSGNSFQNTNCPVCSKQVIERNGYSVSVMGLTAGGACKNCGKPIVNC